MPQDESPATRIEPASPSDSGTLARLRGHVHGLHVSRAPHVFTRPTDAEMEDECRRLLARDDVRAFIAYADAEPVGYVLALIQERPATPLARARRWLYVDQISVEPRWEGRGAGRQLVQRIVELARSLGIDELVTDVWAFNDEAQGFFEACGFRRQIQRFEKPLGQ